MMSSSSHCTILDCNVPVVDSFKIQESRPYLLLNKLGSNSEGGAIKISADQGLSLEAH